MEPLHFSGCRRAPGLVSRWATPHSRQIRSNIATWIEPGGELFAVANEQFFRDPVTRVVHPPGLGTVAFRTTVTTTQNRERHPRRLRPWPRGRPPAGRHRHVHLPQFHRPIAFPPQTVLPTATAGPLNGQAVPDQDPVQGDPRRNRTRAADTAELEQHSGGHASADEFGAAHRSRSASRARRLLVGEMSLTGATSDRAV